MSFNSKNHWMPRDAGFLTDGKMSLGTSSNEVQKRRHNWDAAEEDLVYIKKQAAESIENRPVTGSANMNMSLWGNSSSSGSGQFNDHHFEPESHSSIGLAGNDISLDNGILTIRRRGLLDQFEMSRILKNAFGLSGGVGKGDVTQVRNSMNALSVPMGHPHVIRENNKIPSSATYQAPASSVPIQPDYGNKDRNAISLGSSSSKVMLMGQNISRGSNFMLMGHQYNKANDSMLSMEQPFNQGSYGFASFAPQYGAVKSSFMLGGPSYNKEHENFVMMGSEYGKSCENFKSMNPPFDERDAVIASMNSYQKVYASTMPMFLPKGGPEYGKSSENFKSVNPTFDKRDAVIPSMNSIHQKEDASTMPMHITFDGENSSTSSMDQNYNVGESTETKATSSTGAASKNAEKNSNTFPRNVKSMLSTGIFDGVPVKYVSWCRKQKLRGVIRGGVYLCGCKDCKFSKALNAYQFERHAGAKTKHPNNHIYFENGKTVYGVAQELKSTPPEKLFETIQNVTASPINQKNFRIWKVSYQAELGQIEGKDEAVAQS